MSNNNNILRFYILLPIYISMEEQIGRCVPLVHRLSRATDFHYYPRFEKRGVGILSADPQMLLA